MSIRCMACCAIFALVGAAAALQTAPRNPTAQDEDCGRERQLLTKLLRQEDKARVAARSAKDLGEHPALGVATGGSEPTQMYEAEVALDPFEMSMGGVPMDNMIAMIEALHTAVQGPAMKTKVDSIVADLHSKSAMYAREFTNKAQEFQVEAKEAFNQGFVTLLARYLNETLWLENTHAYESYLAKAKLMALLPQVVQEKMTPLVSTLHADNFTLPGFTFESFDSTSIGDLCGKVSLLATAVGEYRSDLAKVQKSINATAMTLPMLAEFLPNTPEEVFHFLDDLINMGYTEVVVQERSMRELSESAAPIIVEKTGCEWSGASPQQSCGFFLSLAAAVLIVLSAVR